MLSTIRLKLFLLKKQIYNHILKYWLSKIGKRLQKNGLKDDVIQDVLRKHNINMAKLSDYNSPLPDIQDLKKNESRWNKPSEMVGIDYDLDFMKNNLLNMVDSCHKEFETHNSWEINKKNGFGPGFPEVDSFVLYSNLRKLKPKKYLEVGSGLSTFYCSLAAIKNKEENFDLIIECIEPYPYKKLSSIEDITIINKQVQDVELSKFESLNSGDVLFIDSTHALKIDSDVSFLYLEVLPRLKRGVHIHIHDMSFPFNIPYPATYWILDNRWPTYWNEAMIVQSLLCHSKNFKINLSVPILRHYCEEFLIDNLPYYKPVKELPNTFSSLWIERV